MITKLSKLATSHLKPPASQFNLYRSVSTTKLFINGEFRESKTTNWIDIHNPVSVSFFVNFLN